MLIGQGTADTRSASKSDPTLSTESIIAIIAIIVTIMLFGLGLVSRHRIKRLILHRFRRTPTSDVGREGVYVAT
jgi:uncharacterized membrane protein YidH (DUF202 family)